MKEKKISKYYGFLTLLAVLERLGTYDSKNRKLIDEKFWSKDTKNIIKKVRKLKEKNQW